MKKTLIISLSILSLVLFLVLAFFSMPKYSLFSAVDGQLLDAGKPVEGAQIVRQSHSHLFDGTDGATSTQEGTPRYFTETTTTDKEGKFHFGERLPKWNISRLIGWLPHETFIDQSITAFSGGKEYPLYLGTKRNYDTDGELKTWKSVEEKVFVPSRTKSNIDAIFDVFKGKEVEGDYEIQTKTVASTRSINLICDLTSPDTAKKLDDIVETTISGICTFR